MTLAARPSAPKPLARPAVPLHGGPGSGAEERTAALIDRIVGANGDPLHGTEREDLTGLLAGREHLHGSLAEPHPPWWDRESEGLNLAGAVLRHATLNHATLDHANLRRADLSEVKARSADFSHAIIEEAIFAGADCGGALFTGTKAGEVHFDGAMLEDAQFAGSSLRYASLREALLDGAIFTSADLWGAVLAGAEADEANFARARLDEANLKGGDFTGADFTDCSLKKVTFDGATLKGADFAGARMEGASLRQADLAGASLPRVNLATCDLNGVKLAGAWLENTRMRVDQFGGALGEERSKDFEGAQQAYLVVEQNFRTLGDSEGASWAFRRRRTMGKAFSRTRMRAAWGARDMRSCAAHATAWASDIFVEWLCDYGESLWRVVRAFLVIIAGFALFYGLTGSLTHPVGPDAARAVTHNPFDLLVFSFMNMLSTSAPDVGIKPRSEAIFLLASVQGALGIVLIGLFGYVLGNRMHR